MSQPLTTEHFDEVITAFKSHTDERFDVVEHRLEKIDGRLAELSDFEALRENVRHLENRLTILERTSRR